MSSAFMRAALVATGLTMICHAPVILAQASGGSGDPELRQTAAEVYVYAYPLVLMDVTRQVMTARAPANRFSHRRVFPDHNFTGVVSPNADTLYSIAWLDLGEQPLVLSVPAMGERYYLMQMLDAWTNVFAAPGTRTTGNQPGSFAIVGPRWRGELPSGLHELRSPTDMVWLLGRIQTNGKSDFAAVNALQDQFGLVTLAAWRQQSTQPAGAVRVASQGDVRTAPVEQVAAMDAQTFFARFAELLAANPPAQADAPMVARMQRLGIAAGKPFLLDKPDALSTRSIEAGVASARQSIVAAARGADPSLSANGWMIRRNLGTYGTEYARRALVAWVGLGANPPEDAIYPMARVDADGQPLNGAHDYVLHFPAGALPPANAFWSLTMYNERQFFVENPIARYAIGDRDTLKFNADGSLDLYLRHDARDAAREPNWLPAPPGPFNVMLRIYWPKPAVLDGSWLPPPITRTR
jgi:hypothetical protein